MEEKLWNVSSSPHVRDHSSTQSIMRDVVIALLPATIIGIYNFRLSAVLVILTCCVSCMLAEYIWQRLMKQKVTTNDFSALLTGLLLALNLPADDGKSKVSVDVYSWQCICHYRCETVIRRTGSELHEPGTWRSLLFDVVIQ